MSTTEKPRLPECINLPQLLFTCVAARLVTFDIPTKMWKATPKLAKILQEELKGALAKRNIRAPESSESTPAPSEPT